MESSKFTVPKGKIYNTAEDCAELISSLNSLTNLETLELSGASFGLEACKKIAENLHNHAGITVANFADMFTGKKSDEIPHAVKALTESLKDKKVHTLDWSDNAFGPNGVCGFIDSMVGNTTVKSLNINNTGLGPEGGRLVANGLSGYTVAQYEANTFSDAKPCKLEVLKAGRGRLEDKGIIALSKPLSEMGTLKVLYLPQSGITPKGMNVLAKALRNNPDIEELNLYDNNIGKKGAKEMTTTLSHLKKLRVLNFGDCMIGNVGITKMCNQLLTLTTLEELDLSYNEVNDETAKVLVQVIENNPKLKKLELNGNILTKKGIKLIESAIEKLTQKEVLGTLSENDSEGEISEGSDGSEEGNDSVDELAEAVGKIKI